MMSQASSSLCCHLKYQRISSYILGAVSWIALGKYLPIRVAGHNFFCYTGAKFGSLIGS